MNASGYRSASNYFFLRLCVIARGLTPYHFRVIWHSLRHGGWKSLQDELFPSDAVMTSALSASQVPLTSEIARKRVLVIDRSLPRFDRDAGSRATWQYICLLHGMGLKVTVWGHDFLRLEPYASLLEEMGVEVVSGITLACGRWRTWIRANSSTLDYVVIHRPNVAMVYMDFLRKTTKARILYFGVDLRWLRNQRRYEIERDSFYLGEARYWRTIENHLASIADAAYFYSNAESEIVVRQAPGARVRTIPLFIFRGKAGKQLDFRDRDGLLFVGGFAHQPNVDGILWFVDEIFPAVRNQLGDISLRIVGANPPEALRDNPGVVSLGAVSDEELQALYDRSRVVVAPLRYGAGIKGKVVEAVFQHVPLVTTTIGAEGMPEPEGVFEVHDLPEDFAEAVIYQYRNEDAWSSRGIKMGEYVEEHFSAEKARQTLAIDITL